MRDNKWRDRELLLAVDVKRHPAGDQDLQVRAVLQEIDHHHRFADDVFEIVDDNQEPGLADRLDQGGDWLTSGAGGVWITNGLGLDRLDPATGELVAQIAVPQGACESTTVGMGLVWTATCGKPGVARIHPATNKLTGHASLPEGTLLDSEGTIGAGSGSVWIAADGKHCHDCRVAKIDARSMEVTAMIPVEPGASSVRFGYQHVWVVNPDKNLVQKVDPQAERVVQTTKTGVLPRFFDVGEGAVWTLNQGDGTVTRVDPRSGLATNIDAVMM